MTISKQVTPKVLQANRANGAKSRGPNNTTKTSQNARKLGILSRRLVFKDETEEDEFEKLRAGLVSEYEPSGRTEFILVDEIAVCAWKMAQLQRLEQNEMEKRRKASQALLRAISNRSEEEPIPLFKNDNGSASDAQLAWDCEELIVRSGSRDGEREFGDSRDRDKLGLVHIEARLNTSIDGILRYSAAVRRDFYRAVSTLREFQRQRRERS